MTCLLYRELCSRCLIKYYRPTMIAHKKYMSLALLFTSLLTTSVASAEESRGQDKKEKQEQSNKQFKGELDKTKKAKKQAEAMIKQLKRERDSLLQDNGRLRDSVTTLKAGLEAVQNTLTKVSPDNLLDKTVKKPDAKMQDESSTSSWAMSGLALVLLVALAIWIWKTKRRKNADVIIKKPKISQDEVQVAVKVTDEIKVQAEVPQTKTSEVAKPIETKQETSKTEEPQGQAEEASQIKPAYINQSGSWTIVADSVIGVGHTMNNMPCQDSNAYQDLGHGWGICVVSDGAGSAKRSEAGSALVCQHATNLFSKWIAEQQFIERQSLPTQGEWSRQAKGVLGLIAKELALKAQREQCDIKDFAATCMVAIYSPHGVLTTHIGDGRGGYHDKELNVWLPLFTPHSGEEANQTLFITMPWFNLGTFGGLDVPESKVILASIDVVCLMSDGMEKKVFDCAIKDETTGKYRDLNRPTSKVMDGLVEVIRTNVQENTSAEVLGQKWTKYLTDGAPAIAIEPDDRTLLLAVNTKL